MNVLVEGRSRFRVLALTQGRSFRTAEVEAHEDDGEPATPAEVEQTIEVFRRLVTVAEADGISEPEAESASLSFDLASRVDFGHELKQELLELRSERERLRRLTGLLVRAADALARESEVRRRASGNGKVSRE
jgi:Lon protease-like protein